MVFECLHSSVVRFFRRMSYSFMIKLKLQDLDEEGRRVVVIF